VKPAARVGDLHTCPLATPGTPPVPHTGGPILPAGVPSILIEGKPAAAVGDLCICAGPIDTIVLGSFTVLLAGRAAARMGDVTLHGGTITIGAATVLIGDQGGGAGSPQAATFAAAKASGAALVAMACNGYGPGAADEVQSAAPARPTDTAWIDLELVDQAEQPIPYRRYRVTTAAGRVVEGYLGPAGTARITGLPPGECDVEFPDLDGRAWDPID